MPAADVKNVGIIGAGKIGHVMELDWDGRMLIDPTNDFDPSDLNGRTSSEVVADLVAPARVVKAGNTLEAAGVNLVRLP